MGADHARLQGDEPALLLDPDPPPPRAQLHEHRVAQGLPREAGSSRAEGEWKPAGVALPQNFPHLGFGVDPDHQLGNQAVETGVRPVGQGAEVVPDQPLARDDSGKVPEQIEIAPFQHGLATTP